MINFENDFFQKIEHIDEQANGFFDSAKNNLKIAQDSDIAEVIFKFSYDALIQCSIALIAKHKYKIRSVPGHHIKIVEKLSDILENSEINRVGNSMRMKRNFELYECKSFISIKDSKEYLSFVKDVFDKVEVVLHG